LRGEECIAEVCRREGLAPNLYYRPRGTIPPYAESVEPWPRGPLRGLFVVAGRIVRISTFGTVWNCIVTHPLKPMNLIAVPGSILVAADIPLSTIADTILLPVTLKTDPSNRPSIDSYNKGCADWEPVGSAQKAP
jgi:uncharacterized protein YceK